MIDTLLRKMHIKHKLIMLNLFITGIAVLIAAVILLVTEFVSFKDLLYLDLLSQAKIVADTSTACLAFNDQKTAELTLAALKISPNIEYAAIYAKDGSTFATYVRPGMREVKPPISRLADGQFFAFNSLSLIRGIELDRERIGTIYIRSDLKNLHTLMLQHGLITFVVWLLVFGIAYMLTSKLQKVITDPILNLSQLMKMVSQDQNYTLKAQVYSEDEIGALAHGFNAMLEQIRQRDINLQREVVERRRAEIEVRTLNEELEQRVDEKTRQLVDAQEELVRKEKLSILGQLSGSVGHELRNPLGVMNNAIYFLKSIIPETNETVREYLEIIKHEIDNSLRIITDLLDFSRTKNPQTKPVAVCDLIEESLKRCIIPENVELHQDLPATIPLVKVDPLQMGQVFQNLITNAAQAMPCGGSMRIRSRLVQGLGFNIRVPEGQKLVVDTDFVEISIADTGEGITPDNMKKLFQPLFTTKARGIGLGLTVCKNLTEANGGRIEVESKVGKGTRFAIFLPAG